MQDHEAQTPIAGIVAMFIEELRDGWRVKAESPDGLETTVYGGAEFNAALLSATAGVQVKALEWKAIRPDFEVAAPAPAGVIYFASPQGWGFRNYPDLFPVEGGIEVAKSAAQADYETRIGSALIAPPAAGVQVKAEPVAWRYTHLFNGQQLPWQLTTEQWLAEREREKGAIVEPLYAAPPALEQGAAPAATLPAGEGE